MIWILKKLRVVHIFSQGPWTDAGQITYRSMEELLDKLPEVVLGDRAATTTKQYANGFQRWSSWARARSQPIPVLPASPFHGSLYLMSIMQTCNTAAPVKTAFYSIAWAHSSIIAVPYRQPITKVSAGICKE